MKNNGEKNRNRKESGKNFDEENLGKVSGGVGNVEINPKAFVAMAYGGLGFKLNHPESDEANIKNSNQSQFNSFEFHDTAKSEL